MSIRASSIFNCTTVEAVEPADQCFVIIGNTSLSSLICARLIETQAAKGTSYKTYVLSTGVDQTSNVNAIESLSYVATNARLVARDMVIERIHNILTSQPVFTSTQFQLYQEYYFQFQGSGPLGDSITSYTQIGVGPWWTTDSLSEISNFIKGWTTPYALSQNEAHVATNLSNLLGLTLTNNVIAKKPSILTTNYMLVDQPQGQQMQRQIFYDVYLETKAVDYVTYINRVNNIFIEENNTGGNCLKTVHYSTSNLPVTQTLNDACIIWANNLYDYVHVLGSSDIFHTKIKAPVFYRFVTTIPKLNPAANGLLGTDLSQTSLNSLCLGDGVHSRLYFTTNTPPQPGSLPNNSNSGTLSWDVTAYTTDDDLSTFIQSDGSFVRQCATGATGSTCPCVPGQTLLIIEATSLNNRRTLQWDNLNLSVSQSLNSNIIEANTFLEFQHICEIVYQAYTCFLPDAELLPGVSCTTTGICNNIYPLDHTFNRESPQTIILRLLSDLYGGSTYPNPNVNSNSGCCAPGIIP